MEKTIKELSIDEKIELVEDLLPSYRAGGLAMQYLCNAIGYRAVRLGFISSECYLETSSTETVLKLIPEFLEYKPAHLEIDCGKGWFGSRGERVKILEQLLEQLRYIKDNG